MIYESVCKECGQIVGKSKDVPTKDFMKLVLQAQAIRCPNCGAQTSKPEEFKMEVRPARRQ